MKRLADIATLVGLASLLIALLAIGLALTGCAPAPETGAGSTTDAPALEPVSAGEREAARHRFNIAMRGAFNRYNEREKACEQFTEPSATLCSNASHAQYRRDQDAAIAALDANP